MQLLIIIATFALFSSFPAFASSFNESLMVEGHSSYLTKNPDETNEWKLKLIREANTSIEMSTGYCKGKVFENLIDAVSLQLNSNPSIKIHLLMFQLLDFVSEENHTALNRLQKQYPDRFNFAITFETRLINNEGKPFFSEDHTKLIIIDEKYFLLGGTNLIDHLSTSDVNKSPPDDSIPSYFLPRAANDMDVIGSGPMAKKLRKEFFELFAFHKAGESFEQKKGEFVPAHTEYFAVEEEEKTYIAEFEENPETIHNVKMFGVIAGPRIRLHAIGNIYEYLIDKARLSIDIGNMYFFPRESIYNALLNAANRKVALNIITNGAHDELSVSNSTRHLYGHINRMNYFPAMAGKHFKIWEMFSAKNTVPKNTSIYELDLSGVLYHKKVMAVDHRYAIVGSYNLGMKSEEAAFEVVVVIDSPMTAKQLETILNKDKNNSIQISYSQAMAWYFNPFYNAADLLEKRYCDGIILRVDQKMLEDEFESPKPYYPEDEEDPLIELS